MKLCLVNIYVSDLDQAMKWYQEKLGFELSDEHYHHPVAVDLVHDGVRLLLHKAEVPTNIELWEKSATVATFEVDDLRKTILGLKSKDVELVYEEPQYFPAGEYTALKDPFGNVHELAELKK